MLNWLKSQGASFLLNFFISLIANCGNQVKETIKGFIEENYQSALSTTMEYDELLWSFLTDLLADPDDQPVFMGEVREALYSLLVNELYPWCVENTTWQGDEQLVLALLEAMNMRTPTLKVSDAA